MTVPCLSVTLALGLTQPNPTTTTRRSTEHRGRLDDILDRYGDEDEEARDRRRGLFDQRRQQQQQYLDQEGMEMVRACVCVCVGAGGMK